jgi:Uma2 family endonuclease
MAAPTLVSVEEYLSTSYRPDCDYVDGEVLERNVGEHDHSSLQGDVYAYLRRYRKQGLIAFIELRVQVKASRFRIPDVCVTLGHPKEQVLTKPPLLCIEILSREDRMKRVQERIDDYLQMGVPMVWVLDPETRRTYMATLKDGLHEVKTGVLRTANPVIELPLSKIFPK